MSRRNALAGAANQTQTELQRALLARPSNPDECCRLAERVGELQQQELVRLVRSITEVRSILTDDQLRRLKASK